MDVNRSKVKCSSFSEAIRLIIKVHRLSQAEFSRKWGKSPSYVNKILQQGDDYSPITKTLWEIEDIFGAKVYKDKDSWFINIDESEATKLRTTEETDEEATFRRLQDELQAYDIRTKEIASPAVSAEVYEEMLLEMSRSLRGVLDNFERALLARRRSPISPKDSPSPHHPNKNKES